jgi:hypothetical protein
MTDATSGYVKWNCEKLQQEDFADLGNLRKPGRLSRLAILFSDVRLDTM